VHDRSFIAAALGLLLHDGVPCLACRRSPKAFARTFSAQAVIRARAVRP
jgi:hypothetical protein